METKVIYGVFAISVGLPEMSDKMQELDNLATSMINFDDNKGRFIRAYEKLEDAVKDCMDGNGWLLSRTIEGHDGVKNGKETSYYYPKAIEVIKHI